MQIVVCDNGSSDGSIERLKEWAGGKLEVESAATEAGHRWAYRPVPKPVPFAEYDFSGGKRNFQENDPALVFIQTGANLGYAGGNNVGMEYALQQGDVDYIWILNNDTVVERQTLGLMVAQAERNSKIAIVGSKLLQYHSPHTIQALGGGRIDHRWGRDEQIGRGKDARSHQDEDFELEHVVGASMLVRTAAILDIGLIEESYFLYREETDWCIRMRENGWSLMYCSGAIVWHKEGGSLAVKHFRHDYYTVRNKLFLMRKFYPKYLPNAILYLIYIAILPKFVRGQFKRLGSVFKAFYHFFHGVDGSADMMPDFDDMQRALKLQNGERNAPHDLRAKLAGVDFRMRPKVNRSVIGIEDSSTHSNPKHERGAG